MIAFTMERPGHSQALCYVQGCEFLTEPGDTDHVMTVLATHLFLLHGIVTWETP